MMFLSLKSEQPSPRGNTNTLMWVIVAIIWLHTDDILNMKLDNYIIRNWNIPYLQDTLRGSVTTTEAALFVWFLQVCAHKAHMEPQIREFWNQTLTSVLFEFGLSLDAEEIIRAQQIRIRVAFSV